MNLFQVLALIVVLGLLAMSLLAFARAWTTRREALYWGLLWIATAIAIVWPDVTKIIAHALGIGRGADLVLYCTVVTMMIGFLMVYARLRRLRRELTLLVRHLAIRDAATGFAPQSISESRIDEASK